MPAHRTPRWTSAELAVLRGHYPAEGIAVAAQLPGRTWQAIYVKANKLGLHSLRLADAPRPRLRDDDLEEAIRLREEQRWSFARIGLKFGIAEASACNAVLIALCTRRGFTPAERDKAGRLTEAGRDRVRYALRKGLKGVDIQLRLGVSATCVAEQRRRYNRQLKASGKVLLPPPGGGAAYSGVKLTRAAKAEVEALFLQGLGTLKIHQRTGVSKTSCTRIRTRLVRRLRRKGELLPGCDALGIRHVTTGSNAHIHPAQRAELRAQLLAGIPVQRAARHCAIGGCKAYAIRDELAAELAARGETLIPPKRAGRVKAGAFHETHWPPHGLTGIYAFRALLADLGPDVSFADAKEHWRDLRRAEARAAREAEAAHVRTFEDQLSAVASGRVGITAAFAPRTVAPRLVAEPRPPA